MKRLVFYSILFLVFFAACKPNSDETDYAQTDTPPAYGSASVTVYLDGNGPAESRAMTRVFAEMGCDYFEVYFIGNSGGTIRTVSGQWRIGEKAGVSDVLRDVNYDGISPIPASGHGSAVLLAGKSDKTIMAVGRLKATDTNITTATTKVTFELNAIIAGIALTPEDSSFLTAAKDIATNYSNVSVANTDIVPESILSRYFGAFKLRPGLAAIKAKYTFSLSYTGGGVSFNNYGLYVAGAGKAEKMHPAYTPPEGGNINTAIIILDQSTSVTMDNNQTVGDAFEPAVEFTFNTTSTTLGSIFALVFEIPVSVLKIPECRWYMRPGYGVLKYELDDGANGNGGAVLIKTGDFSIPALGENFIIEILQVPDKWRYRWTSVSGGYSSTAGYRSTEPDHETYTSTQHAIYDRVFDITGLQVIMKRYADDTPMKNHPTGLVGDPSNLTDNDGIIYNNKLTFVIGENSASPGYILPNEFYGFVEVTVKFYDPITNVTKDDKFYVLVSGNYYATLNQQNSTYEFDYADPKYLNDNIINVPVNDSTQLQTAIKDGTIPDNQIRIIRLNGSVNLDWENALNVIAGKSRLYVFVASVSGVTLGRGPKGGSSGLGEMISIQGDRSGLVGFFFGQWPFDGLERSPASLNSTRTNNSTPPPATVITTLATYPFTINPSGRGSSFAGYTNKMITDGRVFQLTQVGGGIYNVDLGKGITILPNNGTRGMLH